MITQFQYSLLFPGLNPKESKRMKTDFMEVDQNHKEITQSAYSSPAEHLVRKKPVAPPKQVTPTRFWKWFIEDDFVSNSSELIAQGFFGEVRKVKFKDEFHLKANRKPHLFANQFVALKCPKGEMHNFYKQFHELSHEVSCTVIYHPALVNYVGGFQLGKGTATDPVGIVMEFVSTNLRRALEEDSRLQNRQIQLDIAKQVASGMNFLHSLNPYILHRDLRTPNILVSQDLRCKITDFGHSDNVGYKEMEHKELYTSLIPPECRRSVSFSKEGDVYFFGWVLAEMVMLRKPDEGYDVNSIREALNQLLQDNSLRDFRTLIFACLDKEPSKRPTFQRICVELNRMLKVNIDLELFAQSIYSCFNIDRFTMCSMSDSIGRKLVHQYCIFGNFDGLKELVRMEGKEILNEVDMYETNCAHFAARNGNIHILKFLAENGFRKFNHRENRYDINALTLAIAMKHNECVEFLTAHADKESLNNGLISACTEGNLAYVKLFVEKGADLQCYDPDLTKTPLAWAAGYGHLETVQYLVEKGANIHQGRISKGISPLFFACDNAQQEVIEYLIQCGADVNQPRTDDGSTPVFITSQHGFHNIVKLLIDSRADPNIPRNDKTTPLIIASFKGRTDVVDLLLSLPQVDVNASFNGNTALGWAEYAKQHEVIKIFKKHGKC